MSDELRNARKRYKRRLAKALVLQAEIVSESHDKDPQRAQAVLARMLSTVMELRVDDRIVDTRRADLVGHLRACAYGTAYVEQDDESVNLLIVEGTFDLTKLNKRMVWKGLDEAQAEEVQEIHACL